MVVDFSVKHVPIVMNIVVFDWQFASIVMTISLSQTSLLLSIHYIRISWSQCGC